MKARLFFPRLYVPYARCLKYGLLTGILFFGLIHAAAGQVILSASGTTHGNTDGRTFDFYGPANISGCTSLSFSVDYSFSLPWDGPGNMESCVGECFGAPPCNCDPSIIALPGDACFQCWDFLWVRFMINGVEVGGDLIGDAGTTDAEQSGTISGTFCTNGVPGNAAIEVYTQTWASNESVTFSNITITCINNTPTLPALGPYCISAAPVALPTNPGGISGNWSGNGVSGNTFNPAAAGAGNWTLTFTPTPAACAGPATTNVTVTPGTTPTFAPIPALCQTDPAANLPTTSQNGISGNWSGTGVSGNQFNPAASGAGSFTLTFTPNPGACASTGSLTVMVNPSVTPSLAPIGPFCTGDPSVPLPTNVNGITGNWSGSLVTNNVFNPGSAGNFTIVFNPAPGQCAQPNNLMVQILPAATPLLTPQGPFCSTDPPVSLPTVQDGIMGSWIGNGVTGGNTFNPALTGGGSFQLTFIPDPSECANNNSISVMVTNPLANPPGQALEVCYTLIPFSYTDNLATIVNAINGGAGQQVNWYLDMAGNNAIDPTNPADIQAIIAGGPNQTIYATVFDGVCESATVPVNLVLTQSVMPALTPQGPFCQGDPPANLPTNQSGVNGSWSGPGVSSNTFNPATAGNFTLFFTPAPGQCASPNSLNVTVTARVTPNLTPIGPFCQSAPPANLPANQNGINGAWSGPGVSNNTFNPAAVGQGAFTLMFTPNPGQCANPANLNVTVNTITANSAGPLFGCGNGTGQANFNLTSLNPQVSQGAGTVSWYFDPGATTPVGNPGNFPAADGTQVYATVTGGGCTSSAVPVQLLVLPQPAANPAFLLQCETANGTATFDLTTVENTVSGGAPVAVSWSFDPAGNTSIPNPAAFLTDDIIVYAIVFDGSCQNSAPVTLTVLDAPTLTLAVANPILCNGDGDGSLSLTVNGGQPNYTYDWNVNALDGTEDPAGLGPGTYMVTVSDGNGCTSTASITLTQPAALTMGCSVTNPVITPGGAEGEANVNFTGGTAPYSIDWAGPVTGSGTAPDPGTILLSSLEEGTYTVTVEDDNGCINTCMFTVNGPGCDLQLDFTNLQPESCPGALDGSAGLAIIGGTAPFTINWSDGPMDSTRTGLAAGLYSVTVDDSDGCQASGTLAFGNVNPAPGATISAGDTICENECLVFDLQFQGTAPFMLEYAIDTGVNQQSFILESPVTDTTLEVCPADYGYTDGALEVFFFVLSDSVCTDTLNQLEVLQITPITAGSFNVILCPGDSLTYNGTVYNAANPTGMEVLPGAATNGCDSVVTVTLGFFPPDITTIAAPTCDPAQVGLDTTVLQNALGCDSLVITGIFLDPGDETLLLTNTCDPAQVGRDTVMLQNTAGCDSLVITETTLLPGDETLLLASSCDPAQVGIDTVILQNTAGCDSLIITETTLLTGDETLLLASSCDPAQVGIDTVILQNTAGCDSLVITETTLLTGDETLLLASSCDPAQVGIDTVILQNTAGCDSLVITETTLLPSDETLLLASSCDPAQVGIDTVILQNTAGCDSLVITETTLLTADETLLMASSCDPAQVGIDTVILQNTAGCDSLVITETTLLPSDETLLLASSCDPAQVGIDTVILQNTAGCDSLVITETTLLPGNETLLMASSCDPAQVGVDTVILQNTAGCDSLVITETTFVPDGDETFLTATSCNPAQVGIDTVILQNAVGCDSLVITETTLLPGNETFLSATSCDPAQVGVDTIVLQNALGCDSLVITETTLLPGDETLLLASSCDPAQVGIDTVILQNTAGCDSLVITETMLLPSDETFLSATSCNSAQVGIDTVILQNTAGCDSLVITETTLLPGNETFLSATSCDPAQVGVDTIVLQNALGCDSLVITETTFVPGGDETFITATSCDPAQVGIDTVILQNAAGCDSLVITETTLLPSDETFLSATSCNSAQVGIDTVILQNTAGCDSLVITETTLLPGDETFLSATSCNSAQVGIDTVILQNTAGCDSLVITETTLLTGDETFLMASSCDPAQVGIDTVILQNAVGCDSLVITETTFVPGGDETFLTATSCDPAQAGVDTIVLQNNLGCDSLVITETFLAPPDTTFIRSTLCPGAFLFVNGQQYGENNPSGTEIIENGGANGCDSIIQVALTFSEGTIGFLEGGRPICPGETVELTVRLSGANTYNVNISDGTGGTLESFTAVTGDVTFMVNPTATTVYQISLLTAVGSLCPVSIGSGTTVTVVQASDIQAKVLSDYGGFDVSCNGSEDATVGVSVSGPGLSFQWNTGQVTPTLENVGAGVYTVTVTSTAAGCSFVDSVRVTAPAPIVPKANSTGLDCFSEFSGSIQVENIEGGAGPYEYSLDGQFYTPLGGLPAVIPGLSAGPYTLYLQDANDCRTETMVNVSPFDGLSLYLGEDQSLKLGDSLRLRPQADFDVAAFSWSPLEGLLDSAAFSPYVSPMETTAYLLTAADSAGCSVSDQIFIFVNKTRSLYAPNAFSPNDDGRNDFFTLFAGPDVAEIKAFRIFDRWGGLLFEKGPFQPNIENLGWDGTFNGDALDPAVFVFYAEVEYIDGFTEVVEGSLTLLR